MHSLHVKSSRETPVCKPSSESPRDQRGGGTAGATAGRGSHRRCPGTGATPGFLLWPRGLHVPLRHPLPLTAWKGEITSPPRPAAKIRDLLSLPLTGTPGTSLQPGKGRKGRLPGGRAEAGFAGGKEGGGREGPAPPGGGRSPGRSVREGGWGRTTGPWGPATEPAISWPVPHPHCALGGWSHGGSSPAGIWGFTDGPVHLAAPWACLPAPSGSCKCSHFVSGRARGPPDGVYSLLLHFLSSPWIIFKRLGFLFSPSGGPAPSIRPSSQRPGWHAAGLRAPW